MTVTINGNEKELSDGSTLQEVIESLHLSDKVMAAAVNMQVVKKEQWKTHELSKGDSVELLDFVGGG
jgi:sulfur carrier protein